MCRGLGDTNVFFLYIVRSFNGKRISKDDLGSVHEARMDGIKTNC